VDIAAEIFAAVARLVSPPRRVRLHPHGARAPRVVPDVPAAGQPPTAASMKQFEEQDAG
jgi:hypothetical protein